MKSYSIKTWLITVIAVFVLCCCQSSKEEKHIKIAYTNWIESKAFTYLAQEILRNKGYDVEVVYIKGEVSNIFYQLSEKKVDVFMNFWLPYSNQVYLDKYGKKLAKLNTNYVNARIGLVIPEYMDIYSIGELAQCDSLVNYTIVGFEEDTGFMRHAAAALKTYGLSTYHLSFTNEKAILDSLAHAIQQKKPIVVTGWTPHMMFARYNIRFLDDPHLSFGESQHIDTYSWKGFTTKYPYATSLFSRIQFNDKTVAELLDTFDQIEDPEEAAKVWISEHPIIVANWLPHE